MRRLSASCPCALELFLSPNPKQGDSGLSREAEGYLRRISTNVAAYVDSICQSLKKSIPKLIVHCLIENAKKTMLNKFQAQVCNPGGHVLYSSAEFFRIRFISFNFSLSRFIKQIMGKDTKGLLSLLSENEEMMKRRKEITKKLELLELAQQEIDSVV